MSRSLNVGLLVCAAIPVALYIADYRVTAGLYPGNTGQFLLEGALDNTEGVSFGPAAAGPGGIGGGLPEVFVPNPYSQITITEVSGVNPPF